MMPNISVIIPAYGTPDFLENAINSVIQQIYKSWELIIVDDNNPETTERLETENIVNRYKSIDERIKYIKHPKNLNGANARNTGFSIARGKYIALLDSDDEYMPERLSQCYKYMELASSDVAGVYTGCEFRRNGKTYHVKKNVKPGNFIKETLACTFMFCTGSNIFVRKTVVDELNGFDGAFRRHQDYEFLVRLFEKYTLASIQEVLVIKNNENRNAPNLDCTIQIKQQYLEKYRYIITSLPYSEQRYIYHSQYIGIAEVAMRNKQYKRAFGYYNCAIQNGVLSFKELFRLIVFPLYNLFHRL